MITLYTVGFDHSIHAKGDFSCGHSSLDHYIQRNAKDDEKERLARCFVILDSEGNIIGYYTLSMSSISKDEIPEANVNRKVKYEDIPVILLGRLAVDQRMHGQGIGKFLLVDALRRSIDATSTVAARAVVVDPIDEEAYNFYRKFGFIQLPDSKRMFLPMKTISDIFEEK